MAARHTNDPHVQRLAGRTRLPAAQVARWLEQGFTPAQIERAARLGEEAHAEPDDILAMLGAGLGWRAIRRALRPLPDWRDEEDEDSDEEAFGPPPRRRRR